MNDLALFGHDLFGNAVEPLSSGPVAERFVFPPFSVLDARAGEWQDRKRAWAAMGIQGEVGRGNDLLMNGAAAWQSMNSSEGRKDNLIGDSKTTSLGDKDTSIFDPVVCELVYRWWSPDGGQVLDPFAGGSVRGIVAASLRRFYWGCDLRPEQVAANNAQADTIGVTPRPIWTAGDSRTTLADAPLADLLFSCPPYGNLESYSDDPLDLSTYDWSAFLIAYRLIIAKSLARLKPNRFACFVVGNFRDSRGHYRDLVGETVAAFAASGAAYYNEAVLVTSVGSASMRVTRQFNGGRKLCKTHQNVLVFVKGDWRKAADACAPFSETA
ncbi:MAG: DNA methyltransferase [Armatimonadota bacterium]|nr:DNA methyltransferase [Armatimonadota bacterium]